MTCVPISQVMVGEPRRWVIDTSTYTHLCRAGHSAILSRLAPGGVVLVPDDVSFEIDRGRERYADIPSVADVPWAELTTLTQAESFTQVLLKADMAGEPREHLGECAVVAVAHHRGYVALLDDRAAIRQAERRGVEAHSTLWLVLEAYKQAGGIDRDSAIAAVDDLIQTGMWLPVASGEELFVWAYGEGLLP